MLLLVLIFVLAAFALLLLALVTGTAAWAWISVVVSVVAAGILVYDWAQRRAAVRTGAGERPLPQYQPMVPVRHEEPPTTAIPAVGHLPEPATEVFPALNQQQGAGSWSSGSSYGQPPSGPITGGPVPVSASAAGAATGQASDQTPSGSAERPSGAESESGKEKEFSSQSVTSGPSDASQKVDEAASARDSDSVEHKGYPDVGKAAAAGVTGLAAAGAASAATSWFGNRDAGSKSGADEKPDVPEAAASAGTAGKDDYTRWQPQSGQAPQASVQPEAATPERPVSGTAAQSGQTGSGGDATAGDKPSTAQGGAGAPGYASPAYSATPGTFAGWPAGSSESAGASPSTPPTGDKADERGAATAAATDKGAADSKAGAGANASSSAPSAPAAASSPAVGASSAAPAGSNAAGPSSPPTAPPPAGADPTTALPVLGGATRGAGQAGSSAQRADATQAITPVKGGPPAEPGEETPDSAALATVSKLGDEVLVVDEHPRFHLSGCQTLAGNDTIPLPVKEALEYGFSPCGTCSPVRVLAGRNRAASSS